MRWKETLIGLVLMLAAAAGCQKQCYLTECDANHYHYLGLDKLECDPTDAMQPHPRATPRPQTVDDPDHEPLYLSLAQAIAMALENGISGSVALTGTSQDFIPFITAVRPGVFSGDTPIRVLALDPATIGTDIEASLSKFDARWVTSMAWQTTDQPVGGNFLTNFSNGSSASLGSSLVKPLPTGGVAGITFRTNYLNLSTPPTGFLNPQYRPFVQFQFDQPLLQGYGVEINQIRSSHPGPTQGVPGVSPPAGLLPFFNTGGRVEGILITRVRFDEQRAEFQRQVHTQLANVEIAYWNLYGAYWDFYSREAALRQAFETWRYSQARFEAGRIAIQELAQTRAQYELFRAQRIAALDQVLENERQLRALVGLPVEDGKRVIPIDKPTLAPFVPDWDTSLNEALALRPELIIDRHELKLRHFELRNAQNTLMPDLRLTSTYDFNGIGSELDGGPSNPNNALANLASGRFSDWSVGLRADVPLGFRDAHASLRAAKLRLASTYGILQDQEKRVERFLAGQYQRLPSFYNQIQAQRAQRLAAAEQLEARFKEYIAGRGTLGDFLLLQAQQTWADALRAEFQAIVNYNNAIVRFEYAKGTIMQHNNVHIAEGPLPQCAQVRAVEHERERSKALLLRERAAPVQYTCNNPELGLTGLPAITGFEVPSLATLLDGAPAKGEPSGLPRLVPDKPQAPTSQPAAPPGAGRPVVAKTTTANAGPTLPCLTSPGVGRGPMTVSPRVAPVLMSAEGGPLLPTFSTPTPPAAVKVRTAETAGAVRGAPPRAADLEGPLMPELPTATSRKATVKEVTEVPAGQRSAPADQSSSLLGAPAEPDEAPSTPGAGWRSSPRRVIAGQSE